MKKTIKFSLVTALALLSFSCGNRVLEPANSPTSSPHYVGESYGGGTVVYVDSSESHGLIASKYELSTSSLWSTISITTGATGYATYTGSSNASTITGIFGVGSYAASLCIQYGSGWYLPSYDEIMYLNSNRSTLGLGYTNYLTSTEASAGQAFAKDMSVYGGSPAMFNKSSFARVRAVKAF